jgi:FtsZ-interacting cell division protein ZipA
MLTYRTIMIVGLIVVAVGWIIYGIWDYKMRQVEKSQPKPRSERLKKTQSEVSDWAKQMAAFKKPTYKKPDQDEPPPQQPNS